MQQQRTLRDAWLSTLTDLGAAASSDTLVLGPYADSVAEQLPAPTGDTTPTVATLVVTPVPDGATPVATGFADGTFEAVVALSAWDGPAGVSDVLEEAVRVVRPGGTVWLGEIDAKGLTESMPAARRYGFLYQSEPAVADDARFRFRAADGLGVDAVRVGLRDVIENRADLPVAVVDSAADGVEAVRSGIWPGTASVDRVSLDRVLEQVDASLQPPVEFPIVFTLPWVVVRGRRS